jgi:hypothetical protein
MHSAGRFRADCPVRTSRTALLGGQFVDANIVKVVMTLVAWWLQLIMVAINNLLDYHYW